MSPLHDYLSSLPQHEADALRMIIIAGFVHTSAESAEERGRVSEQFNKFLVRALAIEVFGAVERFEKEIRCAVQIAADDFKSVRAMTLEFLAADGMQIHYRRPDAAQAGSR